LMLNWRFSPASHRPADEGQLEAQCRSGADIVATGWAPPRLGSVLHVHEFTTLSMPSASSQSGELLDLRAITRKTVGAGTVREWRRTLRVDHGQIAETWFGFLDCSDVRGSRSEL
jgi:hypothetical protein